MDIKEMIVDYIFNDEMKEKIVKELNDNRKAGVTEAK